MVQLNPRADALDTLAKIDGAATSHQVVDVYASYIRRLGFERFFVTQVVNPLNPLAQPPMNYSDFPEQIVQYQIEKGHMLRDPVIIYGMRSRHPFTWKQAYAFEKRYGQGPVQQVAKDFNLLDGYLLPVRRPGSPDGGISLAANDVDLSKDDFAALHLVSMHCYFRLEELYPPPPKRLEVTLSPRERDVLQFAAAGKTVWEMSVIMTISEAAVKDALLRARRKLKCVNTTQAVSTAIARDLIIP